MRLSAKPLKNVTNINSWKLSNQWFIGEGQANSLYLQLVDLEVETALNPSNGAFPNMPIRYISGATVITLKAEFDSVDDAEVISITASQPFANDKSIWKLDLSSSQNPGNGNVKITLTEDSVDKSFIMMNVIVLDSLEVGSC